jgi:hypothetical protein
MMAPFEKIYKEVHDAPTVMDKYSRMALEKDNRPLLRIGGRGGPEEHV